jgi:hypothetical protein
MRRVIHGVLAAALLVIASLLFTLAPSDRQNQAPVEIPVSIGQTGLGRNIETTVHGIRLAEVVTTSGFTPWTGTTPGVWVVVDATVSNVVDPTSLSAWLGVDGLSYEASTRPDFDSLEGLVLSPGIPTIGSVLFEIPRDVIDAREPVTFTFASSHDLRLDSAIVLSVRLDDLAIEPVIALESPETGER